MRRQRCRPPHPTSSRVRRWFGGQNAASMLHRTILWWWTPGSASRATTHQAWTRNNLNSSNDNLFNNSSASYNTSSCPLAHFCNLLVHLTQTPWATSHSHKAWSANSIVLVHNPQVPSSTTCLRTKLSRVGKMSWQAHHLNTLILFGMWSFHSLVHTEELTPDRKLSPCMSSSLLSCLATWYPVLTKNSPFFVCSQNIVSGVWRQLSGVWLIASASTLWNIKSINWQSQVLSNQSIRLHTRHSHSSSAGGWSTILVEWFGIHLSFITPILDPSPTLRQHPFFRIGWAATMLLHTFELFGLSFASKKLHPEKYFALKHL